jgi:hypothetical protein
MRGEGFDGKKVRAKEVHPPGGEFFDKGEARRKSSDDPDPFSPNHDIYLFSVRGTSWAEIIRPIQIMNKRA